MSTWDPGSYLEYAEERIRPSLDLIDRIPEIEPATVWDLGCGTGAVTLMLRDRWPKAAVSGLDSSAEMLGKAREHPGVAWVEGDIADWEPPTPVDLILATASLQWVPDHEALFPRLIGLLAAGGVLAIQMPRNPGEPSHTLLREMAARPEWSDRVGHLVRESPVAEPAWYHDLLAPLVSSLDMWETVYIQRLRGKDPVARWTRGTAARPFLGTLGAEAEGFMVEYAALLRSAYPSSPDGTTLFPFRRLFIVAAGLA